MGNLKIQILGADNKENESVISSFIRSVNKDENIKCQKELSSATNQGLNIWNIQIKCNNTENHTVSYREYDADMITGINSDTTSKLIFEDDLYKSEKIIVVIDGNYFTGQSKAEIIRLLKRKISRYITPLLTNFLEINNKNQNDLFFIITKACAVLKKSKIQNIRKILCQSFSGFYDSENAGYVEPRTICVDCENDTATNIPFLFFIQNLSNEQNNFYISDLYNKEINQYKSMIVAGFPTIIKNDVVPALKDSCLYLIRNDDSLWLDIADILKRYKFRQIEKKRVYIEAVFYVIENKCIWKKLPSDYPQWKNVYNFYKRAKKKGAFQKILRLVKKREKGHGAD